MPFSQELHLQSIRHQVIKGQKPVYRHFDGQVAGTVPKRNGGRLAIIPERGVYRLIMRSKLSAAEAFEECVVGTFELATRKNGGYVSGEEVVVAGEVSAAELVLKAM